MVEEGSQTSVSLRLLQSDVAVAHRSVTSPTSQIASVKLQFPGLTKKSFLTYPIIAHLFPNLIGFALTGPTTPKVGLAMHFVVPGTPELPLFVTTWALPLIR